MSTAEELLCSRKWRLTHGLWMLWGWFPFALTAWVGYLTIGVKAKNWKWIVTAVAFFTFGVAWIAAVSWIGGQTNTVKGEAFPEPYRTYNNIAMFSSILLWLGNAAGLQWWVNRKWLVWRAQNDKSVTTPWYATATASETANAQADPKRVASLIDNAFANGSSSSSPGAAPSAAVPTEDPVAASPAPSAAPIRDGGRRLEF